MMIFVRMSSVMEYFCNPTPPLCVQTWHPEVGFLASGCNLPDILVNKETFVQQHSVLRIFSLLFAWKKWNFWLNSDRARKTTSQASQMKAWKKRETGRKPANTARRWGLNQCEIIWELKHRQPQGEHMRWSKLSASASLRDTEGVRAVGRVACRATRWQGTGGFGVHPSLLSAGGTVST